MKNMLIDRRLMKQANINDYATLELKIGTLTPQDVGQMDLYVRMYEKQKRTETDNPTIGILLCSQSDKTVVEYSTTVCIAIPALYANGRGVKTCIRIEDSFITNQFPSYHLKHQALSAQRESFHSYWKLSFIYTGNYLTIQISGLLIPRQSILSHSERSLLDLN